jgi:hypothetical protein
VGFDADLVVVTTVVVASPTEARPRQNLMKHGLGRDLVAYGTTTKNTCYHG